MSFRCLQRAGCSFVSQRRWDAAWFCRSWVATFTARQFEHLWADVGATALPYNGHPLAQMSVTRRGAVLQQWARQMLQNEHPNSVVGDALPGLCVNGHRRNKTQALFDFMLDARKVEIKSSQLRHDGNRWKVEFRGVKFSRMMSGKAANFDDLYLVLFSPKWLHLLKHDLHTGISSAGVETYIAGHTIRTRGGVDNGWEESLAVILRKLCTHGACTLIGQTGLSDSLLADLCKRHVNYTSQFYRGKPFVLLSSALRGLRIQKLVWEIDRLSHIGSTFSDCATERTVRGSIRGKHTASADWIRDSTRVEVKHSQLRFCKNFWHCRFLNVKPDCFDELLLAIYSPRGLDVFRHNGILGLSTTGVRTETHGMLVEVQGPRAELDPIRALQAIEAKLKANNCPHIATILWDT